MNNNEIADRIEEVIGQMFSNYRQLETAPTEYSIFYDPKKSSAWFILIFFADNNKLKEAIRNGVCYEVHSFLLNEFSKISVISNTERVIFFEQGNRPTEKLAIDDLFEKLLEKTASLEKSAGKSDIKNCGCCGHDFDKHQLLCNQNESEETPKEGWIMCPEEDCNCFRTWGTNYSEENVKKINNLKNRIFKLFK